MTKPKPLVHVSGTVLKLGTKQHHDRLLGAMDTLDTTGCFALTELGFGEHSRPHACTCKIFPPRHAVLSALLRSAWRMLSQPMFSALIPPAALAGYFANVAPFCAGAFR